MKIYTITGCGGIGKDTILTNLLVKNRKLKPIISTTSRPMRWGEVKGVQYNFVSKEKAQEMLNNNDFIEHRIYNVIGQDNKKDTWIYGIAKDSIDLNSDNNYIVIVDYQGRKELEKYLENNNKKECLTSFYIDGSYQTRLSRYLTRGHMEDSEVLEAIRRFEDDNKNVLPAKLDSDYVINNEYKINNAVNRILDIMEEL